MEMSLLLIKNIAELFIIILIGYILVKTKILKESDGKVLSTIVLYGAAPCAIINSFQIKATSETMSGLMLAFLGAAIVNLSYIIMTKFISKPFGFTPIERASIIYSNSGNLIFPLVTAILGGEWVLYASGYMVLQTVLMWSHGKSLVCNEPSIDIKKILLNVNMIAIFIGAFLFITKITLPAVITETMSTVGSLMGPLSMMVIGMGIANMNISNIFSDKRVYLIAFLRLVAYPLVMILLFKVLPVTSMHAQGKDIIMITMLAAAAPVASSITQFAQIYNKHPGYASVINVMTVIFCIVTMPLMIMLYQWII